MASFIPSPCASSKLGVKFTTQSYTIYGTDSFHSPLINNYAHWKYDSLISDTSNWVHLTGSFIADSAYQYLIIGNFFDDANTDTLIMGPASLCYSYFFIDDICVSSDSTYCDISTAINAINYTKDEFEIFPNPIQTELTIIGIDIKSILIYDISGRKCREIAYSTSVKTIDVSSLGKGMYFVRINTPKRSIVKKIIKL